MSELLFLSVFSCVDTGKMKTVLVIEGDTAVLRLEHENMFAKELVEWMFGDTVIAHITQGGNPIVNDHNGKFTNRLHPNEWTGSLTIKDTRITDSGLYQLRLRNEKNIINHTGVNVTVTPWPITCGE